MNEVEGEVRYHASRLPATRRSVDKIRQLLEERFKDKIVVIESDETDPDEVLSYGYKVVLRNGEAIFFGIEEVIDRRGIRLDWYVASV